jgi:hypothetical protein
MSIKLKLMQEAVAQEVFDVEMELEEAIENGDLDLQQDLELELEELAEVA